MASGAVAMEQEVRPLILQGVSRDERMPEQCIRMELRGDKRAGSALRKARKAFLMLR